MSCQSYYGGLPGRIKVAAVELSKAVDKFPRAPGQEMTPILMPRIEFLRDCRQWPDVRCQQRRGVGLLY